MGLRPSSYEGYCLDEAVVFFGLQLESMLEEAGHKPSKGERRTQAAREALLKNVFGDSQQGTGYADPAMMF